MSRTTTYAQLMKILGDGDWHSADELTAVTQFPAGVGGRASPRRAPGRDRRDRPSPRKVARACRLDRRKGLVAPPVVLTVDVGGSHVKLLTSSRARSGGGSNPART